MTSQSTALFRIASGAPTSSLGATSLAGALVVPNRDDTAQLPVCTPQFQYAESPIATQDFEGGTTAPLDFNLPWSWPFALMYPTPSQGEENRMRQLLKSGSPTAATTEVTGVAVTGGISFGGVFGVQLAATGIETGIEIGDIVRVRDSGNTLLSFGEVYGIATNVVMVTNTLAIPDGTNRKVLRGRRIKPGITKEYVPMEFAATEASVYQRLINTIPDGWSWGFRNGQLGIRGAWSGQATAWAKATSAYSSGLVTETASPIFCPKTDSIIVRYAGTDLSIATMDASVQHPLAGTKLATQLASSDLVPGRINSSGSFSCFLDTDTRLGLVNLGTAGSLFIAATDVSHQSLVVAWSSVKLTNDVLQREGTFISEQISWQSQRDTATNNASVRILTFPA